MRRWADCFFTSIRQGLRPHPNAGPLRSGAGRVEPAARQLWGSNQAALSLAIWSTTGRVRHLSPTYNYPLHQHDSIAPAFRQVIFPNLVHVHYHWLFAEDALRANPLLLQPGPLSSSQRRWLDSALPIG
jgi:hypothetical protein